MVANGFVYDLACLVDWLASDLAAAKLRENQKGKRSYDYVLFI